ncbi:Cyclopentanol dehydrogenase [compost metagenome]|uniref:SDR family oxidoreductase n=1 Tax=Pseudomonas putida TaxID=303 RepID=A0A7D5VVG8_PSEPU|nr:MULTISPECIES: SDR family oxidoreductase [Pseudomonas]MDH0704989.1 SDR family oxidoreductase [Pseudomonas sp. GD03862]MPT18681.1 SDR family oxidoreductase [Pseudomonas sp.]PTV59787.1 KR domain-containing protein [Pseudomonas putida]QLJ11867.1 SDR family oxidoreductase [Pseudomonas putida]
MLDLSLRLDDAIVLITGGGRGNGASLAHGFAIAGATVIVTDIDMNTASGTAKAICDEGGKAHAFALDICDEAACNNLADLIRREIGSITALINNAGLLFRAPFASEKSPEQWRRTLAVNVTGMFNVTHAFLAHLKETKGSVLNIGSIHSYTSGLASLSSYVTSKGAVLQFTKALASELAADGIRVNGLAPGSFPTAMSQETRQDPGKLEAFLSHVPMGRTGEPHELVGPAVFLTSHLASYITGAMVPVDGGYLTR